MTEQDFEELKDYTLALNKRVTDLQDSVSLLDSHYQNYNNLFQLEDVTVNYPAENDVLVFDKNGKWKNAQYDTIGVDAEQGGGSGDFYIIGIGDPTPPTNQNVYSAARTKEDFLSSKEDDQADGTITFNKGLITDSIYSRQWQEGPLGYGLVYHLKDSDDQLYTISYMELDELYVRRKATFDTLEIKKLTSVGGRIIVTPASNEIIRVETVTEYYNGSYVDVYRCFFRSDDGENAIKTDFVAGDLAQCRQFNISSTGTHENASNRYYWRLVMGVGADYIDLSMTDMDTATTSDAPAAGDTIVQLGNKNNLARQNAIILSAYDDNAPSISMYQGINTYTTQGHDVMQIAYDTTQDAEQMYFNLYGRMYVGAKDQHTYMKYDPLTETVTIRGKLLVESGTPIEDLMNDIVEQANTELNQKIDNAVDDLLAEINGVEGELSEDLANLDETLKSDMAGNLGYNSWNDFVAAATNDKTIISGGYLNTTLIQAGAIKASMIAFDVAWGGALQIGPYNCDPQGQNCSYHFRVDTSGNLVTTGDVTCNQGTFNNITINSNQISSLVLAGGKIGPFTITGSDLTANNGESSLTLNATSIQYYYSGNNYVRRASFGASGGIFPGASGIETPIGLQCSYGNPNIPSSNIGLFLDVYGSMEKADDGADYGNVALYIKRGGIKGLRLWSKVTNAQSYVISNTENFVIQTYHNGDTNATAILPNDPYDGQIIFIKKATTCPSLVVSTNTKPILHYYGGRLDTVSSVSAGGTELIIAIYSARLNGGSWIINTTTGFIS